MERMTKVSGIIGAFTAGSPLTITTNPPFLTPQGHEEVKLLVSNVPDLAVAGTAIIQISDNGTTYNVVDARGYNVRADRLLMKARWVGAEVILPLRVVIASDPQRVVVLSFLPRTDFQGLNAEGTE